VEQSSIVYRNQKIAFQAQELDYLFSEFHVGSKILFSSLKCLSNHINNILTEVAYSLLQILQTFFKNLSKLKTAFRCQELYTKHTRILHSMNSELHSQERLYRDYVATQIEQLSVVDTNNLVKKKLCGLRRFFYIFFFYSINIPSKAS
jgi:hypothetical protein